MEKGKMNPIEAFKPEPIGFWKDVPGYDGIQASIDGQIRRIHPNGYRILNQFKKKGHIGSGTAFVKIKGKECSAARIVYTAHVGPIPEGKMVCHKDGITSNNAPYNLQIKTFRELAKSMGRMSGKKSVLEYDPETLECTNVFRSAVDAAKKTFVSKESIADRCRGKTKYMGATNGMEYCWEDDKESYKNMLKRIERGKRWTKC